VLRGSRQPFLAAAVLLCTAMVFQLASAVVLCLLATVEYVHAGDTQPPQTDSLGKFKIVGNSLVSAQQVS
jgi:hypothetical protein